MTVAACRTAQTKEGTRPGHFFRKFVHKQSMSCEGNLILSAAFQVQVHPPITNWPVCHWSSPCGLKFPSGTGVSEAGRTGGDSKWKEGTRCKLQRHSLLQNPPSPLCSILSVCLFCHPLARPASSFCLPFCSLNLMHKIVALH